tara:strand:+ start:34 stop:276 length:243 start_codon:yes stop_codon:yes gene_type:complete
MVVVGKRKGKLMPKEYLIVIFSILGSLALVLFPFSYSLGYSSAMSQSLSRPYNKCVYSASLNGDIGMLGRCEEFKLLTTP